MRAFPCRRPNTYLSRTPGGPRAAVSQEPMSTGTTALKLGNPTRPPERVANLLISLISQSVSSKPHRSHNFVCPFPCSAPHAQLQMIVLCGTVAFLHVVRDPTRNPLRPFSLTPLAATNGDHWPSDSGSLSPYLFWQHDISTVLCTQIAAIGIRYLSILPRFWGC